MANRDHDGFEIQHNGNEAIVTIDRMLLNHKASADKLIEIMNEKLADTELQRITIVPRAE